MTDRVKQHDHQSLTVFGVGADLSTEAWRGILRQTLALGLLTVDLEGYGTLALTPASRDVLKGERTLMLRPVAHETHAKSGRRSARGADLAAALPPDAQRRFERLRAWRAQVAKTHGVPAYVIFHDATLRDIALQQPRTLDALGTISGVGTRKREAYGPDVVACLVDSTNDQ
jgi:ATP-dependent DNA helicase RecQ